MIDKLLCEKEKTLLEALKVINDNGKGAVFITDSAGKLEGVLTDGDIRRFLLEGKNLHTKTGDVIRKTMVFANKGEKLQDILKKINDVIRIIPIVDENMRIVDFVEMKKDIHVPVVSPDLKGNELNYLVDAFLSTWISSKGQYIDRFEKDFSQYIGTTYGVTASNGTTALHLALLACGIGPGDEVIVPDMTFAATINAVIHANATPVIVDVERDSWCIDPREIEKAITPKTRGIIPVHLYGQPADMDAIMEIARKHKIHVIEDCAEAHGAMCGKKKVGSIGDIGCFSFFGNKVITTGEGGMCVTNNKKYYDIMMELRDHGMSRTRKYWHDKVGYNYRMTNLQAAIGVAQLERIDEILSQRKRIESNYRESMAGIKCVEFQVPNLPGREKITWLVSLLIKNGKRDFLIEQLKAKGFDARNFFYPLGEMDIYKKYKFSNRNSKEISAMGISLPSSINLTKDVIREIALVCRTELN